MKVIISYRDKHIRREIAGYLRDRYPNSTAEGFDDVLMAAKAVYNESEMADVVVVGVEGIKLIPMLRKTGGSLRIIILADSNLHRDEAYSSGADAYITKPFDGEDLVAAIEGSAFMDLLDTQEVT